MRLINELLPLRLYPNRRKVYYPVNEKDKRHGAAIFLMGSTQEQNENMIAAKFLYGKRELYRAYYIDRNVMAYINSAAANSIEEEEFDEIKEEALSEAMFHTEKSKFRYENASTMDQRIVETVYNNDAVGHYVRMVGLKHNPVDRFIIYFYSSQDQMKKQAKVDIEDKDIYSYSYKNTIHLISYIYYDERKDGPYKLYALSELINCIILNGYPSVNRSIATCTGMALSGQLDWLKKEKNKSEFKYIDSEKEGINGLYMADLIQQLYKTKGSYGVKRLLEGDVGILTNIASNRVIAATREMIKKTFIESNLSSKERNALKDSDFGLPEKRKYPMPDESHVKAAIRMFNHCDPADEAELAKRIKSKMKKYGIPTDTVGPKNRLSKYIHESAILNESFYDNIEDLKLIFDKLDKSKQEEIDFDLITNSKYIQYGYIHYKDNQPVGFIVLCDKNENNTGDIYIGVVPEYDGKDIKKTLLRYMFEDIPRTVREVNLRCDIDDRDLISVAKDLKFEKVSVRDPNHAYFKMDIDTGTIYDEGASIDTSSEVPGLEYGNEGYIFAGDHPQGYYDVLTILGTFSKEDFDRISFYSTYRNSKYIKKRIILKDPNDYPMAFMDVYHFPSDPERAQITTAVGNGFRGHHLCELMAKRLLDSNFARENGIKKYIWHVSPDNIPSQKTASKVGFVKGSDTLDKYGRYTYVYNVDQSEESENISLPAVTAESGIVLNESSELIFNEVDSKYDTKLRKYLFRERLKNAREVMTIYNQVKQRNPNIDRTYRKLSLYKGLNLYVDTSYYHEKYLKNAYKGTKQSLYMYFDFLSRLMENEEVFKSYKKITYFFPVTYTREGETLDDLLNWKTDMNVFSVIVYMIRKDPDVLKRWANKDIIFVGKTGYFKLDFSKFILKNLTRFRKNLSRLLANELLADEDPESEEIIQSNTTTSGAAISVLDIIEDKQKISFNDISGLSNLTLHHLSMEDSIPKLVNDKSSNAVFILAPDSSSVIASISKKEIASKNINNYYKPKL